MLMVEISIPRYVHKKLRKNIRRAYNDIVKEVVRSRSSVTRVFIEDCPKGWWLALQILREGSGRLYLMKEVKYIDIPSKVMELSMKHEWSPEYENEIEEELRKWGLKI